MNKQEILEALRSDEKLLIEVLYDLQSEIFIEVAPLGEWPEMYSIGNVYKNKFTNEITIEAYTE